MLAHITFTPIGTGEETKELIAKALRIIKSSELDYQLTSMGTIIEGEWEEIMAITRKCHEEIKKFSNRLSTQITIDDRKGLKNRLRNNALEIEYVLGEELETNGLT